MNTVVRGLAVYLVLLVLFRIMGKRALAQITTFDFVLLLIISETTQQALSGDDRSLTTCFVLVVTLMLADLGLSLVKARWRTMDRLLDDIPLVIVENGRPLADRMARARVDEAEVLGAARELSGLERMDQIRYAVLEPDGTISIIPR
jgi:uncharacterized membrane protein YcaP (DUF421 family)